MTVQRDAVTQPLRAVDIRMNGFDHQGFEALQEFVRCFVHANDEFLVTGQRVGDFFVKQVSGQCHGTGSMRRPRGSGKRGRRMTAGVDFWAGGGKMRSD